MVRNSNPAGSEVYEALFDMRRRLRHDRVLGVERTAKLHRAKGGGVRSGRLVGSIVRRGSGLVWKTPGLRRGGRWHVQARSGKSDRSVDRFDGRTCMHGGPKRRPMDSEAVERPRDVPVGLEVVG